MGSPKFPSVDLDKLLSIGHLPAMPQLAIRIVELSQDPANGPAEFALVVESDPGLTVQLLKFINSSYFGFRHEISNVRQAIALVGVRTVKHFTLWNAVYSLIPNPKCGPFDLKSLWQDSLRRALFARTAARALGMKEAEEAFVAALLQDMAVPLLAREVPETYARLFGAREKSDCRARLSMLEEHVFGWNHAKAAGIMARRWNLPEAVARLIEDHLAVEQWVSRPNPDVGKLAVAMSALLPTTCDSVWPECPILDRCYQKVCPAGGPSLAQLLETIDQEFAQFAPVLRIAAPASTLGGRYAEATAGVT
jgi:HD-like signal output (HDOD) protein